MIEMLYIEVHIGKEKNHTFFNLNYYLCNNDKHCFYMAGILSIRRKTQKINQSIMINKGLKTTQNNTETTAIIYNNFEVDTLSGIRNVHTH